MHVHLGHFLISVKQIIKFNTEEAEVLNYRTRLCWHISWRTKMKSNKGNKGVSYKTLKPTKSCSQNSPLVRIKFPDKLKFKSLYIVTAVILMMILQ